MSPAEETAMTARWGAGDHEAGKALVHANFGIVRRFFANKVNSGLEDLIQETFTRCLEYCDRFEGRSSFRSFALGIAQNVLFEFYRKQSRGGVVDFGVSSIHALDPSPSQCTAELHRKTKVLQAMRKLPLNHQVALELRYWENMTVPELAETLGVAEGTIKSRLHHGRRYLQNLLDPDI